jgi:hypothetical protein
VSPDTVTNVLPKGRVERCSPFLRRCQPHHRDTETTDENIKADETAMTNHDDEQ